MNITNNATITLKKHTQHRSMLSCLHLIGKILIVDANFFPLRLINLQKRWYNYNKLQQLMQ